MIIVEPKVELIAYTQLPPWSRTEDPCSDMSRVVEIAGRTSWKSEGKMSPGSADGFCVRVVNIKKDLSIAEHASATLRFTFDRYASHQLVRHRIAAYTQESTHYIDYSKERHGGQIQVCRPLDVPRDSESYMDWVEACEFTEKKYLKMIAQGTKHHSARFALVGCLKTELVATYDLRMWRTVFDQRARPNNTPEIEHAGFMAARVLASLCPEVMSDWGREAEAFFASPRCKAVPWILGMRPGFRSDDCSSQTLVGE